MAVRTPLLPVPRLHPDLLIKPESLQPTGSFKLRGAYTAISAAGQRAREHGVIAHSSGNHGHAVAYAAALLGVRAVVVVPSTAPKVKTDAIEYYGAELVTVALRRIRTGSEEDDMLAHIEPRDAESRARRRIAGRRRTTTPTMCWPAVRWAGSASRSST